MASLHSKVRSHLKAMLAITLSDHGKFSKPLLKDLSKQVNAYLSWLNREGAFHFLESKKAKSDKTYLTSKEKLRIKEEGGIVRP